MLPGVPRNDIPTCLGKSKFLKVALLERTRENKKNKLKLKKKEKTGNLNVLVDKSNVMRVSVIVATRLTSGLMKMGIWH